MRGSVLVMHGANWHTARPNRSDAPRSALLGMYTRPIYLTQEDMPAQLADLDNPSELVRQLMGAQPPPPRPRRHRPVAQFDGDGGAPVEWGILRSSPKEETLCEEEQP